MNFIDISVELSEHLPTWPGGYGVNISHLHKIGENSDANVSRLDIDVHSGTHIDAPLHFVEDGKTTTDIPLERLCGSVIVLKIDDQIERIDAKVLESYPIPTSCKKILLRTRNTSNQLWQKKAFDRQYVAITADAAQWLVDHQIELIGIDYCSIQKFDDPVDTHQILLRNEVIILEGLDLSNVKQGEYHLLCFPIKVQGIEGVPVRAVLTY
jgi:arylformamidase